MIPPIVSTVKYLDLYNSQTRVRQVLQNKEPTTIKGNQTLGNKNTIHRFQTTQTDRTVMFAEDRKKELSQDKTTTEQNKK